MAGRRLLWAAAPCLGIALSLGACAKKPVVVQADPPPLEVPIVPPRLLGPVAVVEPPPTPVETPEPAPVRPGTRGARPGARANDPVVKVEPPPESGSKPADPNGEPAAGGTSSTGAEPAPLLRTDSADDAEVVRKVRETLTRANDNLKKLDYNGLSAGAKSQYDTARTFVTQAEEALKGRNLTWARYVAGKAETLSASLLNR